MESTEAREVGEFHSIEFRGIGTVLLAAGAKPAVEVTTAEDLQPRVRTEVRDGVLVISLRWWLGSVFRILELQSLEVRVTLKELRGVRLSGAGAMRSASALPAKELKLHLSGAGRLSLEVQAAEVEAHLSGAGRVELSGTAEELEIQLSGAGAVSAESLAARKVRVRTSGAGECRVRAAEVLKAELSGAGSVRYLGSPRVESRITGVGKVEPLD